MSPSNNTGPNSTSPVNDNNNYIEHPVSKMDTLVGVAIKYGVEVADIKRLNGLATDLQMFALKTVLIPLPGRHPPSPVLSSGSAPSSCGRESCSDRTPPRPGRSNLLDSFESLRLKSSQRDVSPAMSTLQKYYGLKSTNKNAAEGTEMAVYRTSSLDYLTEELLPKVSSTSGKAPRKKYTNLGSTFLPENGELTDYVPLSDSGDGEGDKSSEKSVRRRQKVEVDSRVGTTERLLKEENGGNSGFSPVTGKSLAMRPKSAGRTALASESEQGWGNSIPVGLGDSIIADEMAVVRKSLSTSSLQDHDNSGSSSSSVWPTSKWSLKPDLQALSAASIFDSLPKPMSGRKSKAALD